MLVQIELKLGEELTVILSKGQLSYVNWVELIRFKETRNYVQRVLENINVYKYMLSKEPVKIDKFFQLIFGGRGEIRTLGTILLVRLVSNQLVSTAHPLFQIYQVYLVLIIKQLPYKSIKKMVK